MFIQCLLQRFFDTNHVLVLFETSAAAAAVAVLLVG